MIISHDLSKEQYANLQSAIRYNKYMDNNFINDLCNENLQWRINELIPKKYVDDDRDLYYVVDNVISSWINLLREWFLVSIRKDITTYIYWARVKYHPSLVKIGITYDIMKRSEFPNNKYYDYHCIRYCGSRYSAAYIEYKVRTEFCRKNSELIELDCLSNVIDYIRNFKGNKQELRLLGWGFME